MIDVKLITKDPEGVKSSLQRRFPREEDRARIGEEIDLIAFLYQEVKLTRQAIEEAKHLQRQLEKDLLRLEREASK